MFYPHWEKCRRLTFFHVNFGIKPYVNGFIIIYSGNKTLKMHSSCWIFQTFTREYYACTYYIFRYIVFITFKLKSRMKSSLCTFPGNFITIDLIIKMWKSYREPDFTVIKKDMNKDQHCDIFSIFKHYQQKIEKEYLKCH